jgi:hypothetical protein
MFDTAWDIHPIIDFVTNAVYDYSDKSQLVEGIQET